ncbi:MAG: recombinase family protein [Chloroflexi bacterium]|nr:recombinase family protein [Chloroflexota bacterium]
MTKKQQFQPLTPAALYARVSSDRQDVDLSVSAQLRALKDYAKANGYSVAREYVDEAESGRIADRPQFRKMIEEGSKAKSPFDVILVWKFSRFTRKREHAVAFKAQLRRKGIRVVSITEQAEDNATGRLLEGIIESVDEYYSENLAQEVVRGMREAASRGYFLASRAPFGYKRIKVSDGVKDRPTLEVDPDAAPVVKEIFESSRRGNGLKEICKELNGRGITNRGKRWQKNGLHYLLTNEAYTGTAVWGVNSKDQKAGEPVRVENAWPALVSRETFDAVQQGLHERAPYRQRPARVGSQYLLSGLLRCGVCGKPYSGQAAKSGKFAYYVCSSLFREGAGACSNGRYLNSVKLEDLVIEKVRERILTEETITELVTLVAEEIDALAGEMNGRLKAIDAELADVESRLENLYQALETKQLPIEALSPRILSLKGRQDQLTAAREEAEDQLERRRADLPTSWEIKGYVADFREFLKEGTFPERKALVRNFVQGIEIVDDEATLTYTIPMPQDGVTRESASVLDFVQSGPPDLTEDSTGECKAISSVSFPPMGLSSGMGIV